MNRQIIDEKTGIGYTLQDNYYLPNLHYPPRKNSLLEYGDNGTDGI